MRYLVLSDIPANLEAFEAVRAEAKEFDHTLVLGDVIGYGADPNAVVDRLRVMSDVTFIRGNHDKVGTGLDTAGGFNHLARRAIQWTAAALTADNRAWVAALDRGPVDVDDVVEICHGSPFDEDAYIFDELDAVRAIKVSNRPLCLFGHTHYPVTFELSEESFDSVGSASAPQTLVQMRDGCKYLINPGSVG